MILDKNTILHQLNVESNNIADKYDKFYEKDINNIIEELVVSFNNLSIISNWEKQEEILDSDFQSMLMFWSAANSLMSSLELFRRGYPREHLVVLRHNIELISTAYYIHENPSTLKDLLNSKKGINSPKFVSVSKKVIPITGIIYGMLSDAFVHISTMHIVPNGSNTPFCVGGLYDIKGQKFKSLELSMMLTVAEILNSFIELVFYDKVKIKRFWEYQENGSVLYNPISEIRERQKDILERTKIVLDDK